MRCLDPGEIGLYFDGVEYTHIPPAEPVAASTALENPGQAPARRTDTENLLCRVCGTLFSKRPGRGRPPKTCYECKAK